MKQSPYHNQNKGYESAGQERKNLMNDNPIDSRASGGSWMSKHTSSRMGSPMKMDYGSPMEKELVGKQGNLPEGLKAKIEAAPEMRRGESPMHKSRKKVEQDYARNAIADGDTKAGKYEAKMAVKEAAGESPAKKIQGDGQITTYADRLNSKGETQSQKLDQANKESKSVVENYNKLEFPTKEQFDAATSATKRPGIVGDSINNANSKMNKMFAGLDAKQKKILSGDY